ncbi:hypothetical protein C8R47DRAFT_1075826 [Mycena vitilis]|nr:hypothetical protein C8R47DRAFT_1075826 [Mycena vitilis]
MCGIEPQPRGSRGSDFRMQRDTVQFEKDLKVIMGMGNRADEFHFGSRLFWPALDVDSAGFIFTATIRTMSPQIDLEGCSIVLARWEVEKTSVISNGWDSKSNLDLSILLSLSSPRLKVFPHSSDLLSLLSMLPNGLSDVDLVQSNLQIENVLGCKAALIRTALGYTDSQGRLKILVPVKEYMQKVQPPKDDLIRPLRKYFQELLELHDAYGGTAFASGTVARITANLANIENVLQEGLQPGHRDLASSIYCICYLSRFSRHTGQGVIPKAYVATECLDSWYHDTKVPGLSLETTISKALENVQQCNDVDLKSMNHCQTAISLASSAGNSKRHSQALLSMAQTNWYLGCYSAAQANAKESQRLARISANLYEEVGGLNIEAACCQSLGDFNQGLSLCNQGRALLAACGMSYSQLSHSVMNTQAEIHKLKSEYSEARNVHHQILENTIARDPLHHAFALLNIAEIDVSMGITKEAVQKHNEAARSVFRTAGYVRGPALCDTIVAELTLREGNISAAKTLFSQCLKWSVRNDAEITSYCLEHLANASRWDSSPSTSHWIIVFLVQSLKLKDKLQVYKGLLFLGQSFKSPEDESTAMNLFNLALEGFTYMDVHCSRAECMLHIGDIHKRQGDLPRAVELWETAGPLFRRSSQSNQVEQILERLDSVRKDWSDV